MEECPVHIHRVTDGTFSSVAGVCPVNQNRTPKEEVLLVDIDVDSISEVPSVKEYKKLRNVMSMITRFYRDGSERKRENYETMKEELAKLEIDFLMCSEQLAALDYQKFDPHPKAKEYRRQLFAELERLKEQRQALFSKRDEFQALFTWSKQIVEICEWLELNMDDYCKKNIKDLPPSLFSHIGHVPELDEEKKAIYRKGLAEITYNLDESQDFFQASIDGRLNKYHNIEKQIIEAQLNVMVKYSEDNPRRKHIQAELEKDLEYVKTNMEETPEGRKRREKMLKNHQEFFKVLKYHKDKLGALGKDQEERKYDPKFDHYNDT